MCLDHSSMLFETIISENQGWMDGGRERDRNWHMAHAQKWSLIMVINYAWKGSCTSIKSNYRT